MTFWYDHSEHKATAGLDTQSQNYRSALFFVVPLLPVASFIASIWDAYRIPQHFPAHHGWRNWKFYTSAALGLHAIKPDGNGSMPLIECEPEQVHLSDRDKNSLRWARALVLLCGLAQAIITVVALVSRSCSSKWSYMDGLTYFVDASFDHENALVAIGGGFAILISIVIQISNWEWRFRRQNNQSRSRLSPSIHQRIISLIRYLSPRNILSLAYLFAFQGIFVLRQVLKFRGTIHQKLKTEIIIASTLVSLLSLKIWFNNIYRIWRFLFPNYKKSWELSFVSLFSVCMNPMSKSVLPSTMSVIDFMCSVAWLTMPFSL